MMRYQPVLGGGPPASWEAIASALGVSARQLRSARSKRSWHEVLTEFGQPLDDENLVAARCRLGELIHSRNEGIAIAACRAVLQLLAVRRLDMHVTGEVVQVATFNLDGVSPQKLRELAHAVATAEGVSPARRCLPAGDDDGDVLDAEFGEPVEDAPSWPHEDAGDDSTGGVGPEAMDPADDLLKGGCDG